jgi:hypothetical protein
MALTKDMHTIKIGHGAYSGANALKFAASKAAAVRELRARGLTRDNARAVINRIAGRANGYEIAEGKRGLVEVHAMNTEAAWTGYC